MPTRFLATAALSVVSVVSVVTALAACDRPAVVVAAATTKAPARELVAGHKPYVAPKPVMLTIPTEQARVSGGVQSLRDNERVGALFTKGGAPLPVFLQRNQTTYTGGADDSSHNISSVVGSGQATVGGWPGSDADWNATKACVQSQFSRFNVTITDVRPSSGEYVTAHMGGSPDQLGLPQGVGGIAPIDSFSCNIIPRAIVYIFSDVLGGSNEENCEVAAQEISHAFSLDHEFLCQDPMTYLSGCGNKTFQDQAVSCGEFQARECNCNRSSQNSVQDLLDHLGPSGPVTPPNPGDNTPPTASLASPANGATLQGNQQITVTANVNDNVSVSSVTLNWNFTGDQFPCPGTSSGGAASCTMSGSTATWTINVGQGDRTFSVTATDENNNTTTSPERTIHLTADGNPTTPPVSGSDTTAPVVSMISPDDGATLTANTTIQVSATATDDSGQLADVELLWTFSGDSFPCPLQQSNVTCAITGNTYTWSLNVGVGQRAFQVKATDLSGNSSTTPERTITLSTDASPPSSLPPGTGGDQDVAEPNNTAQTAFGTRCGTAIDVVATPGDDDWYSVEAPAGTDVQAGVSAAAGSQLSAAIFASDGTTLLEQAPDAVSAGPLTATSTGPTVLIHVTTPGTSSVAYRLSVQCGNGEQPPTPTSDDSLEPNNTIDQATRSFCGQERDDLVALDDDLFVIEVRQNDTLHVVVRSDGADATILDKAGNELGAQAKDVSALSLPAGDVYVKVSPTGNGAPYDIKFSCAATSANPAAVRSGCASTSPSSTALAALVLAGLAIVRRRRR